MKKTIPCIILCVLNLLRTNAQTATNVMNNDLIDPKNIVTISGQQETDRIFEHKISPGSIDNASDNLLVIFEPNSKQALGVKTTNDVYFIKGKLFLISRDIQAFWITLSRPLKHADLTLAALADVSRQSAENQHNRENEYKTMVDLRPLLKSETNRRLAQPLILKGVRPALEDNQLVVYFESYTHINGKIVLDDQLNPVSMAVIPSTNTPPKSTN